MSEGLAPGLYFGLPADDYHADPALSSSGVRDLLISPLTFYCNHLADTGEDPDTKATATGTAFHARIVEGRDVFQARYALPLEKDDHPDALDGAADLKARCKELGLPVGGNIAALCERIATADPRAELWPLMVAEHRARHAGKTFIKPDAWMEIEFAAGIVERHPTAAKAFAGGFPEVSMVWLDEETGVPMRSRPDYLKVGFLVDLKTFSNPFGMPVANCVARAVASNRYHTRAAMYLDGVERVKALIRKQGRDAVHIVSGEGPTDEWLDAFAEAPQHSFAFVFIEQGRVPNILIREFARHAQGAQNGATPNAYFSAAWQEYRAAVQTFVDYRAHFGDGPWLDPSPMIPFVDADFPVWMAG